MTPEFIAWPKTPRFENDEIVVTEKIDGTNAQILITDTGEMFVGSRTRWITPEQDNFGFARWCEENKEELLKLGHGRHYGEWYGSGIQRGYQLETKKLALFNTFRPADTLPSCVEIVPILYEGAFSEKVLKELEQSLRIVGSRVTPGYMNVEGMCIFWKQSKRIVKWIINK